MNLGVVLARRGDLPLARALTEAALRAGDEVRWFVMDDGVAAALDGAPDVDIVACATSADQRGLALPASVQLGSQDDHAALLAWADRVVALT